MGEEGPGLSVTHRQQVNGKTIKDMARMHCTARTCGKNRDWEALAGKILATSNLSHIECQPHRITATSNLSHIQVHARLGWG